MALQISNPRIIRLVTEVSERTGEDAPKQVTYTHRSRHLRWYGGAEH